MLSMSRYVTLSVLTAESVIYVDARAVRYVKCALNAGEGVMREVYAALLWHAELDDAEAFRCCYAHLLQRGTREQNRYNNN